MSILNTELEQFVWFWVTRTERNTRRLPPPPPPLPDFHVFFYSQYLTFASKSLGLFVIKLSIFSVLTIPGYKDTTATFSSSSSEGGKRRGRIK